MKKSETKEKKQRNEREKGRETQKERQAGGKRAGGRLHESDTTGGLHNKEGVLGVYI